MEDIDLLVSGQRHAIRSTLERGLAQPEFQWDLNRAEMLAEYTSTLADSVAVFADSVRTADSLRVVCSRGIRNYCLTGD